MKGLLLILVVLATTGCASLEKHKVKAWQKSAFTQKGMQWAQPGFEGNIRDHVYFAKEGASGSAAVSGGGCGCN